MQEELDQVSSEFYKKVLHVNFAIVKKSSGKIVARDRTLVLQL